MRRPSSRVTATSGVRRIAACSLALALLAGACGGEADRDAAGDPTGDATGDPAASPEQPFQDVLTVGSTAEIISLDPADSADALGRDIILNFNSALYRALGDGEFEPDMAAGPPEVSEDGLRYTIELRDDVRFGDGLELTADLYAQQFQRSLDLGGLGPGLHVARYVESVEAVDDHTIAFNLRGPYALFPRLLSQIPYSVAHPEQFPADEIVPLPDPPVYGTGPWILTDYSPDGERIVFEPNPHWRGDPPPYSQVVLRPFADPQTMALALSNGEIDVGWKAFDEEQVVQLDADPDVTVGSIPFGQVFHLVVNHRLAPTDDAAVKQAIAALIDREEIVDTAYGGTVTPVYAPIPPGTIGGTEAFRERYDPPNVDLARELLEGAGYSEDNPATVVLAHTLAGFGDSSNDAIGLIARQLQASGMIEVDVQTVELSAFFEALLGGESYNLSLLNKNAEPDASGYVTLWVADSGTGTWVTDENNEPLHDAAEELLALLERGGTTLGDDARDEVYSELSDAWAEHVVTIPIFLKPLDISYRPNVSGDPDLPGADWLGVGVNNVLYFDRVHARQQ